MIVYTMHYSKWVDGMSDDTEADMRAAMEEIMAAEEALGVARAKRDRAVLAMSTAGTSDPEIHRVLVRLADKMGYTTPDLLKRLGISKSNVTLIVRMGRLKG